MMALKKLIPKFEFILQSLIGQQGSCPHCHSSRLTTVATKYRLIEIKRCEDCQLFFTSPIYQSWISPEFYDKFYQAEGTTTAMPTPSVLSQLIEKKFQDSDKYFGDRLESIGKFTEGRKLLEIGSSWGYFLYQAQLAGFEATGIELSDTRRNYGIEHLQVNMHKNMSDLKDQKFDLIYTSHTLEHFTDLSTIFRQITDYLQPGGKLLIEVPNFDFFAFGHSVLSTIGAVHPMGFCSEFFQHNLPNYGLNVLGFYDCWQGFPHDLVSKSSRDIILVAAEKLT